MGFEAMSGSSLSIFSDWPEELDLSLEEPFFGELHGELPEHELFPLGVETCKTSMETFTLNTQSAPAVPEVSPTEVVPQSTVCPCCEQAVATKTDFHSHVSKCFMERQKHPQKHMTSPSHASTRRKIDSIRQSAARLSLSRRIALLESLNRLAHPAKGPSASHRAQELDMLALTLLYSPNKKVKFPQPHHSHHGLKIEVDKLSRVDRESFTPNIHDSIAEFASPLNPSLNSPRNKRKRDCDVAHALRFSPKLSPLEDLQHFEI